MMDPRNKIPNYEDPIPHQYIQPILEFIDIYASSPFFYHDFIYACPFNRYLIQCFYEYPISCPINNAWTNLFKYLASNYTIAELADLVYEAFYDLSLADCYLQYIESQWFDYLWPTGEHFCDPLIPRPLKPEY